jgi:23S rRNA (adenine-N6)-dimethyltransferase
MEHKQKRFGQNFLKSPALVRRLVGQTSIAPNDTVIDIGAGRGIITAELAGRAQEVISIEKDERLAAKLRERFREVDHVRVVRGDFLDYRVTESEYKIFANIPFNLTARIIRKILYTKPLPKEAFLVMQREAARKYAGLPRESLVSLYAKPYFEFEIARQLKRTDFSPMPDVDPVLLRMVRRAVPLVGRDQVARYREFVRLGFCSWRPNLRIAYKNVISYKQWKRVAREVGFNINAKPTDLSFEQWLVLFARCQNRER